VGWALKPHGCDFVALATLLEKLPEEAILIVNKRGTILLDIKFTIPIMNFMHEEVKQYQKGKSYCQTSLIPNFLKKVYAVQEKQKDCWWQSVDTFEIHSNIKIILKYDFPLYLGVKWPGQKTALITDGNGGRLLFRSLVKAFLSSRDREHFAELVKGVNFIL
jgi:hypothetical protein